MKFNISKATPILFIPDWRRYEYENGQIYTQKFSTEDHIIMQVTCENEVGPEFIIEDCSTGRQTLLDVESEQINETTWMHQATITNVAEGIYTAIIGDAKSEPFMITSNSRDLEDTRLIRYRSASNVNSLYTIFNKPNGDAVWFELRIECGFKSNGLQPKISAETFRDQNQSLSYIYAHPYMVETLTFGTAEGLPAEYCELINDVFCCNDIFIDGRQIVRSEGATPQIQQLIEGTNRYVFTLDIEKKKIV